MSACEQVERGLLLRLGGTPHAAGPRLVQTTRPEGPRSLVVPGLPRYNAGIPILVWEENELERQPCVVLKVGTTMDTDRFLHTDDAPLERLVGNEAGPGESEPRAAAWSTLPRPDAPKITCEIEVLAADRTEGWTIVEHVTGLLPTRFALEIEDAEGTKVLLDAYREGEITMVRPGATTTPGQPGPRPFRWMWSFVVEAYEDRLAEAELLPTVRLYEGIVSTPSGPAEVVDLDPEDL